MLFLSFLASLSQLAFSRPMYTFVGPVTHYSCRLGLMVFFTIYTVNSLWPSSLGLSTRWASTNGPQHCSTCYYSFVLNANIWLFSYQNWFQLFILFFLISSNFWNWIIHYLFSKYMLMFDYSLQMLLFIRCKCLIIFNYPNWFQLFVFFFLISSNC